LSLRRRELSQAYLVRLMAAPSDPRGVLALSMAVEIMGADPDARLFQEIRERLGLGYDLSAAVEQGPDWAVAVLAASAARDEARGKPHRDGTGVCARASHHAVGAGCRGAAGSARPVRPGRPPL